MARQPYSGGSGTLKRSDKYVVFDNPNGRNATCEGVDAEGKNLMYGRDKMCLGEENAQGKRRFLRGSSEVRSAWVSQRYCRPEASDSAVPDPAQRWRHSLYP